MENSEKYIFFKLRSYGLQILRLLWNRLHFIDLKFNLTIQLPHIKYILFLFVSRL